MRLSAARWGIGALLVSLACGVDERDVAVATVQPYQGPLPSDMTANGSDGSEQPDPTDTPEDGAPALGGSSGSGGSGNEQGPDVTVLDPPPGGAAGSANTGSAGSAGEPAEPGPDPEAPGDPEPPAPRVQVFVLFGQSNMWGVPAPQAEDLAMNPRVEVLTLESCGRHAANQWVVAQPPLHGCVGQPSGGPNGPGLGPGDYFGRTLAEAFPEDTILLVPNAIPGVSIDVFQPGQQAYNSMLSRARMAQQRGEIRGIIFHQGESDSGQATWPNRVQTVVSRLRSDLGIGNVPFVAGELLYGGCCQGHNTLVNQLPNTMPNAFVARAEGFRAVTNDGFGNLHFDTPGQREFGRRYGELMVGALE